MAYFTTDAGVDLFYTNEGDGPAVLLLHGWSCDGSDWAWLAADLQRDHRVIVPDHVGHGRSTVAPTQGPSPYTPDHMADDAVALVRHLKLESYALVGHSMGGVIATVIAARYPELVSRIVLAEPAYGLDDAVAESSVTAVRAKPVRVAKAVFGRFYCDATPSWLPTWHARRIEGTPPQVIVDAYCGLYDGPAAMGRRDASARLLAERRCPTLSIYAKARKADAEWEDALGLSPGSRTEVWDDAGHFLHQEFPDRFAAATRAWLAGQDGANEVAEVTQ